MNTQNCAFHSLGPHTRQVLGTLAFSHAEIDAQHGWFVQPHVISNPSEDRETLRLVRNRSRSDEWEEASAQRMRVLQSQALRLARELDQAEQMFRALDAAQHANEVEGRAQQAIETVMQK